MKIKVQRHLHIAMVETYEHTFDVDIPDGEDSLEWLKNSGLLDEVDWGSECSVTEHHVLCEEHSIVEV